MRTITTTLYKYDELPTDEAKQKAIDWYRGCEESDPTWHREWCNSLNAFVELFNLDCDTRYERLYFNYGRIDDNILELKGLRLWKYLHNRDYVKRIAKDCPFTGYCGDESILDPLRAFIKAPNKNTTLEELLRDCLSSFETAWEKDREYLTSDESIIEHIQINEYEFTENGSIA